MSILANNKNSGRAAPWSAAKAAILLVLLLGSLLAAVNASAQSYRIIPDSRRHNAQLAPIFDDAHSPRIGDFALHPSGFGARHSCKIIQVSLANNKDQFNIRGDGNVAGADVATITLASRTYSGANHGGNPYFKIGATQKAGAPTTFLNAQAGLYTLNGVFEGVAGSPNFAGVTCAPFTTTLPIFTLQVQHRLASANGARWISGTVTAAAHTATPTIATSLDLATALSIESSTSRVDTGVRLHQFFTDCLGARHEFEGPDQMEVGLMYPYDSSQGGSSIEVTLAGGDSQGNVRAGEKEQHLRLYFKSDASFTAGQKITTTIKSYVVPDCDDAWRGTEDAEIRVPASSGTPYATYVHEFTIAERVAWADQGMGNTVGVSINRSETSKGRVDTGIRIHTSSSACPTVRVELFDTGDPRVSARNPFILIPSGTLDLAPADERKAGTLFMQSGASGDQHYRMYTKSRNELFFNHAGIFTTQFALQNHIGSLVCQNVKYAPSNIFASVTVTVHDFWEDRGGYTATVAVDPPGSGDSFSPVRLATITNSQDLGVTIQRTQDLCRRTNLSLAGQSDYFELNAYTVSTEATVPGRPRLSNVDMDSDHVRLQLRADSPLAASVTAGFTLTASVVVSASDTCPTVTRPLLAGDETFTYTVTVADAAAWRPLDDGTGGENQSVAATVFHGPELSLRVEYTGITVHYDAATAACENFDVAMLNHTDILELQRYDTASGNASETGGRTSFDNVEMKVGAGSHLALRFRPYVQVFPGARTANLITVSVALDYNEASCASAYHVPYPTVLSYALTINPWTKWQQRASHQPDLLPNATYYPATMTMDTDTGVRLQRSSLDCQRTDLRLLNLTNAFALSLEMDDGSPVPFAGKTDSAANINMDPTSAGDGERMKAALYFRANPPLATGRHVLSVEFSSHSSCPERPPYIETFTVSAEPGEVRWNARLFPQHGAFDTSDLVTPGADYTGVRFHVSAEDCDETAVRLIGNADIFELAQFDGNGAEVSGVARGSELAGVDMRSGAGAANHHVRLFFKDNYEDTPDMAYVIRLEGRAGAGCSFDGRYAAPWYFWMTLTVNDDYDSAPEISSNLGGTTGAPFTLVLRDRHESRDTGLLITVLDVKDAENGWPQMAIAGADASSFRLVTLGAYSVEYERLVLSLRIADTELVDMAVKDDYVIQINATDHDGGSSAALSGFEITVAQITLRDPVTEEAVRGIGGVVVRAIGLSGIDSVLGRAQIDGGDARLAQRDGSGAAAFSDVVRANEEAIENGDFDLREFMDGQAFALPLGVGGGAFDSGLGVWGKVDLLDMSSGPASLVEAGDIKQEGEVFSAQFGVDALLGNGWLAGIGYGVHEAESTYQRRNSTANVDGTYKLDIDVVQPYVGFDALGGRLAASAGFGSGDLSFADGDVNTPAEEEFEAGYRSYALGYGMVVSEPGAADELSVRGAFVSSELDIDGDVLDAENSTLRLALAYVRSLDFGASQEVRPSLEVAYASSWGADDADDGDGYEVVAGLGYAVDRLEAEASYLYISTGGGTESKTSGASLSFRYRPLAGGLGLGFAASPAYGPAKGSDGALWEIAGATSLRGLLAADRSLALRAGIDYGVAVPGGVLTPYGRYDLAAAGAARELGMRMDAGARSRWILSYRRAADAADALKIEYWLGE